MGSGPVLVMPPGGLTHMEWYLTDTDAHEQFCDRLAAHRTLVLYDRHGCGLSDRNRTDFTAADDMLDVETVIEAIAADKVDLFGISWGGSPALTYAARHPEKVDRMVLYGTFAQGRMKPTAEQQASMDASEVLRRNDFEKYLRMQASLFYPSGSDRETFQSLTRMLRDSAPPEITDQLQQVEFDTQSVLRDIDTPTLVIHRRGDLIVPFIWGQYMARRLANAEFLPLDGDAHLPWADDADSVLGPTIEFLTGAKEAPAPAASEAKVAPGGTAIILFADIVDSTALTEAIGDEAFRGKARTLDETLRAIIRDSDGTPVEGKLLGDGVLAVFASAKNAIEAAMHFGKAAESVELGLHLGIHAGDVIREEGNVFGGAVNIAARISGESEAGEVLVSDTVRGLARTSAGVSFEDRGERKLKGVGDPVRVWRVQES
jgi:class 3 adenylate cyclase